MSSVFSIFCGTTFSPIFHFFKEQYQCLQELTKHYSNATVEEKLGVLSIVAYIQGILNKMQEVKESRFIKRRMKNLILVLVFLLAFAFFLEILGFLLCTFLLLIGLFRSIERKSWIMSVGGGAIISFSCYVLFGVLLKTQLPKGILGF